MSYPQPLGGPKLDFTTQLVLNGMRLGLQVTGRVLPGLTARWAKGVYFSPQRKSASGPESAALKKATHFSVPFESAQNIEYPGGDLKAYSWGEGPVVLFSHGWGSSGIRLARPFIKPLTEKGYKVVAFDHIGHGTSPGKQAEVTDFARGLLAIEKLTGPIHALVSHSIGAAAASIAMTKGLAVGRAIHISPVCWMLALPEQFSYILKLPKPARLQFEKHLFDVFPKRDWAALSGDKLSSQLTVPGLIIHDHNDVEVHYEGAVAIHNAWKHSKLISTKGLGHRRVTKDPQVIKDCVHFIRE